MTELMKGQRNDMPKIVLRSTLGYLERESARRAKGGAARLMSLGNDELLMLVDVLRREVGINPPNDTSERVS